MARMRRFKRRTRGPSPIRAKEWVAFAQVDAATQRPNASILLPSQTIYASWILSPDEMTTLYDEPTLLRSILRYSFVPNTQPPAGDGSFLSFGLIKANFETAAGGALPAALLPFVPLPFFDGDSDWIYEWHSTIPSTGVSFLASVYAAQNGNGQEDIRARRKFPDGHGLLLVIYNDSSANVAYRCTVQGRLLFANR